MSRADRLRRQVVRAFGGARVQPVARLAEALELDEGRRERSQYQALALLIELCNDGFVEAHEAEVHPRLEERALSIRRGGKVIGHLELTAEEPAIGPARGRA